VRRGEYNFDQAGTRNTPWLPLLRVSVTLSTKTNVGTASAEPVPWRSYWSLPKRESASSITRELGPISAGVFKTEIVCLLSQFGLSQSRVVRRGCGPTRDESVTLRGEVEASGVSGSGLVVVLSASHEVDRRADVGSGGGFEFSDVPSGHYKLSVTTLNGDMIHHEYVSLNSMTNHISVAASGAESGAACFRNGIGCEAAAQDPVEGAQRI